MQQSYWYGGVDLLATRFNYQYTSQLYLSDDDASIAIRPYVGWENDRRVGLRGRWWFYGTETDLRSTTIMFQPIAPVETRLSSLDLDLYRRFHYDTTSFLLGVGTKIASLDISHIDYFYPDYDIIGGGISVFAEGRHPLYRGLKNEWAFIGYGRFGLLTGRIEYDHRPDDWEYVDTNMAITELGLGLEWKHKFRRGDFMFQLVSEIQRWETNMTSDLAFDAVGVCFGGQW